MGTPRSPRRRNKLSLVRFASVAGLLLVGGAATLAGLFWLVLPLPIPEGPVPQVQPIQASTPPLKSWPAAIAKLPDEEEVVGVSVNGQHRAYLLEALSHGPDKHLVNDLVGGRPLSVAYCALHDCIQVVTGDGFRPLELEVAGLDPEGMLLSVDKHRYRESTLEPLKADSPAFPYQRHAWERTTWGAWKRAHPDTDVFLGVRSGPNFQRQPGKGPSKGQARPQKAPLQTTARPGCGFSSPLG
jgi:hypothetical protein